MAIVSQELDLSTQRAGPLEETSVSKHIVYLMHMNRVHLNVKLS